MKTLIAITTLGRVWDQRTLYNLPTAIADDTKIIVQQHEYEDHLEKYGDVCGGVVALPPEINNLGGTRRWLFEYARDSGYDAVIMLDDDLDFYWRQDPAEWQLTTPSPGQLTRMFVEVIDKLAEGYMHVGVSGREGNNREREYGVENVRYMRFLAYRTDMPSVIEHGRINGMSDFDVNLQLLKSGFRSYVFYRYAQGQRGTQTPGGCAINRTKDTHTEEINFMVREHAGFVIKRTKNNKTGGEFGTRLELTIHWKLAFEESQR